MKYIAVLDSENEFTEEVINDLKNTGFLGDNPRYAFEILSIEKQERKVGKWIEIELDKMSRDFGCKAFKCSCCGFMYKSNNRHTPMRDEWNGCPRCFADMRGSENE